MLSGVLRLLTGITKWKLDTLLLMSFLSMAGFQTVKNLTLNSNCTVVLQADTIDKQKTVLVRLTEWI